MSLTLAISRARAAKFDDAVTGNPIASAPALPAQPGPPKVRDIITACARFHGLTVERIAMYLAREMTPCSFPMIGRVFDRDHTTVLSGAKRIERLMFNDAKLAADVEEIRRMIGGQDA